MAVIVLSLYAWTLPAIADEPKPQALPWLVGPTEAKLGDQALLKLPTGYRFLGAQETQQLLKQMGNFPSGSELGLITATGEGEQWFMVVRYIDAGYVKDDEAANWDADALMTSIKEGTEEDNKTRQAQGFPPLIIRGWEEKPHYDKTANKVVWAISAQERESGGGELQHAGLRAAGVSQHEHGGVPGTVAGAEAARRPTVVQCGVYRGETVYRFRQYHRQGGRGRPVGAHRRRGDQVRPLGEALGVHHSVGDCGKEAIDAAGDRARRIGRQVFQQETQAGAGGRRRIAVVKILLLLLGGLKFGKIALTGGTMLLSMVVYSFIFGWWYAVGFVLLILFHELGHYAAAKQRNLNVGAPTFIPFVGAWIQLKEQPMDVETEAYVGIAGPVAGTFAAMACYYAAEYTQSQLLLALAYAGFMINLFNLIPLSPLDGGRITAIISPKVWWLGVPILIGLFVMNHSPMLLLIAIMAIPHVMSTFRGGPPGLPERYYEVPLTTKVSYGLYYLGLAAFLGIMSYETHLLLPSGRG
jgi:Zn-dependent protease